MRVTQIAIVLLLLLGGIPTAIMTLTKADGIDVRKGYGVKPTGLLPVYPEGFACSPLTSLYASWDDIDGSRREERHTGVDGGRMGEWVFAPAAGRVRAVWRSNWGWGPEGSLLIVHSRREAGMRDGPPFYYSAFDHLKYDEIKHLRPGQVIARGEKLARVQRPGGNRIFLPEMHWEVWEVQTDQLSWETNRHGAPAWRNDAADLIDPLYMLSFASRFSSGNEVHIVPHTECESDAACRGFTYILPCPKSQSE